MPLVLREARIRAEAETTDVGERRATRTSKTRVEGARDALEAAVALISAVAAGRKRRPAREDPGEKHDPESGRRRRPAREDPGEKHDPEPVVTPAIRSEPFRTVGDPFGPEGSAVAARAFDAPAEELASESSSEPPDARFPAPAFVDDAWFDARGLPRAIRVRVVRVLPTPLGGGAPPSPAAAVVRRVGADPGTPRGGGGRRGSRRVSSSFAKTPPIASSASFHAERVDLVLRPGFTLGPGEGARAGWSGATRHGGRRRRPAAGVALRVDAFADATTTTTTTTTRVRARRRRDDRPLGGVGGIGVRVPRVVVVPRGASRRRGASRTRRRSTSRASRRRRRRVLGGRGSARESGAAGATLRAEMDVSVAADDKTRGGRALEEEAALREEEAALRVALAPLHLSLDQRVAAFLSGFFRGFGDASALEEEGYAVVDSSGVSRSSSDASSSEVSDADIEASDAASSSSDASSSASDAASSDRTGSSLPRGDGGASTFFSLVEVRAPSVRLEYLPRAVDFDALVRGSYVEAINLVPFRAVPLTLAPVSLRGVGAAAAAPARRSRVDVRRQPKPGVRGGPRARRRREELGRRRGRA